MNRMVMFVALLAVILVPVKADYYVKQLSHTDEVKMMGQTQPAQDVVSEQWIGENRFAMISEQQSVLIDVEKGLLTLINHGNKTYTEMEIPVDITKYMPEPMAQMMSNMMGNITVKVNPTGETKKINNWNCKGFDVQMNVVMTTMDMKVWATTDVPFDWKKVSEDMLNQMQMIQLRLTDDATEQFKRIEGFWILTETTASVMGNSITSRTSVEEIAKKDPPADVYQIPAGYKKSDTLSMGPGGM